MNLRIYIAGQMGMRYAGEALDAESATALVEQMTAGYRVYKRKLEELGPTLTPKFSEHFDHMDEAEIVAYDEEGDVYFYEEVEEGKGQFTNYSEVARQNKTQEEAADAGGSS